MKQIRDFGDERNRGWCVYCGGPQETRDHVPSKALLDEPYPENLPVVPACIECNSSFSLHEEYVACFLECALTGSVEAASERRKIANIFTRAPALASRLRDARTESEAGVSFVAEQDRIRTVVVKLARGHAAYEQNEPQLLEPHRVSFTPFNSVSDRDREQFEGPSTCPLWPEVGSRAMTRVLVGQDLDQDQWIDVQKHRYRYRVDPEGGFRVQMVFREYLAAEVVWQ